MAHLTLLHLEFRHPVLQEVPLHLTLLKQGWKICSSIHRGQDFSLYLPYYRKRNSHLSLPENEAKLEADPVAGQCAEQLIITLSSLAFF